MPLKSIIDIDVNDDKFNAFVSLWQKYQDQLAKMPQAWAKAGTEIKKNETSFESILAALLARDELEKRSEDATKKIESHTKGTAQHWHGMVSSTGKVAHNIQRATSALLKWTKITGFVSGILGAGGLFGIDRLAQSVAAGRRSSMGLGVSYGQEQAFSLNFKRFVNPEAMLGNVAQGLFDVTSPQYRALLTAGIPANILASGNAADVSVALLHRLPQLLGGVPTALRGSTLHAYGLDTILGLQDVNRYLAATPKERAAQERAYRGDVLGLGVGSGTQLAWNNLQTQLQRAGKEIENTFVKGLVPLTGPLEKLSSAFEDDIRAFMTSKDLKRWIVDASDAMERFAKYLDTDKFQKTVKEVASGLGILADDIKSALQILGVIPRSPAEKKKLSQQEGLGGAIDRFHQAEKDRGASGILGDIGTFLAGPPKAGAPKAGAPKAGAHKSAWFGPMPNAGRFSAIEAAYRLPKGLLWNVYGAESSYGRNAGTSSAGAQGPFQFMPGTARQYGLTDPWDTNKAAVAAARYFAKLLKEFHGYAAKAVAGYNWGEGNVEKDIARHGTKWRRYLPSETKGYLEKVLPGLGSASQPKAPKQPLPSKAPTIQVFNETGGSAVIISSMLAT